MYGTGGTVSRMKTTFDLPDALVAQARTLAAREGTTMRALVEEGLRHAVARREDPPFELRDASFGGRGTQPGVDLGSWEHIRELIYRGRGT